MWGSSTAQIFGSVSPAMHERFGLEFEKKWMARFGLNYYGCCEPLHARIVHAFRNPEPSKDFDQPLGRYRRGRRGHGRSLRHVAEALARRTGRDRLRRGRGAPGTYEEVRGCEGDERRGDFEGHLHRSGDPTRLWRWMDIAMETASLFGG
jgi:hypothetical protein